MPITIKESPEPFTFRSAASGPILAECEAYRSLLASILRYGKREIMGRSVLISGHRGSGKTTLVRWAVQQAQKQLSDNTAAARPLLVPLHGPDLLGGKSVLATDSEAAEEPVSNKRRSKKRRQPQSAGERNDNDTRAALRMLTEALHRAYVSELGRALVERTAGDESLHELAAQLIVELDHAPDLDALRFIWNRAGKLQSGVLFPPFSFPPRDNRQGYRELLAASAVIEGYRRVAGKLEGVEGSSRQSEFSEKAEQKSDWSGKDFFNPLVGLLAGGAAAAGVVASSHGATASLGGALAGILTAVGSTAALNYSSTRSRQTSRESKLTFTWDTSIASLDRMLPVMVERIVDAGLAPIFVVDELDKIEHLEKKMEHLIRHLKHLVTEKTFFCFLSDRSYFEHIVASSRSKVYGKEHTFFSDRLFVHYSPQDMHKYLFDILNKDKLTDDNERLDWLVLPYLLLERSKMHPLDLRRALSDLTDQQAAITLPVGKVREPEGYGMAVLMQGAVEEALEQPDLRSRLSQDPNFARMAYDALYLPARSWENGDEILDISREALRTALEARMTEEGEAPSSLTNLSEADLDLLHTSVLGVARYLREPQTLVQALSIAGSESAAGSKAFGDEYKAYKVQQRDAVRQVIPVNELLLGAADSKVAWPWLRDPFGRLRPPKPPAEIKDLAVAATAPGAAAKRYTGPTVSVSQPTPPQPLPTTPTADRIAQIRALNTFLRSVSDQRLNLDKLATQIHLLGISPAWPSVDNAIKAFESDGPPGSSAQHQSLIESYAQMFDALYGDLRRALILATLMTLPMRGTNFPRLLERAMQLLAADLRLGKSESQKGDAREASRLRMFDREAQKLAVQIKTPVDEIVAKPEWDLSAWGDQLRNWMILAFSRKSNLSPLPKEKHYHDWREFLVKHLRGGSPIFYPELTDLLLRGSGDALPFPTDWNEITYLHCAKALRLPEIRLEPLLFETILVELGFAGEVAAAFTASILPQDALILLEIRQSAPVQHNGARVLLAIGGAKELHKKSADGDEVVVTEQAAGSLTAGWRLSAQHAVIPVFAEDASPFSEASFPPPSMSLILFEAESPSPPPISPGYSFSPGTAVFRIARSGSADDPSVIVAPGSLDAAVEAALGRLAPMEEPPK